MKIVKPLVDVGLLIQGVTETFKNVVKEQKGGLLGTLAATLGASLLGNMVAGKGVIRGHDRVIEACEGVIRAGEEHGFCCCLIL